MLQHFTKVPRLIEGETEKKEASDVRSLVYIEQDVKEGQFLMIPISDLSIENAGKLQEEISNLIQDYGKKAEEVELVQDLPTKLKTVHLYSTYQEAWADRFEHFEKSDFPHGRSIRRIRDLVGKSGPKEASFIMAGKQLTLLNRVTIRKKQKK